MSEPEPEPEQEDKRRNMKLLSELDMEQEESFRDNHASGDGGPAITNYK